MTTFNLTGHSQSGWRDIQVRDCETMREAIQLAEEASGCYISHGRSGEQTGFHPGLVIHADTGEVVVVHERAAKPQEVQGPPEVLRAIAAAIKPPRTQAPA